MSELVKLNLQEQLQENLIAYLDGFSSNVIDGVCQVVVDTFNEEGESNA